MSLIYIIPVFSATGAVKFINPTDSSKDLTWARQAGQVGLQVTDSDLDVAVKRVLLPADYTTNAATAATTEGSSSVTLSATTTVSATPSSTTTLIAKDDTVLIGNETVRKVVSASTTAGTIVLNKPLTNTATAATIAKVTQTLGSSASCPDCAAAQLVTIAGTGNQILTLNSSPVKDSGSATNAIDLTNRFTSNADTVVNGNDVFLSDGAGTAVSTSTTVQAVTASNGLVNISNSQANKTFYAVYWGSEANDTGSSATVTSQSDPTGITVVLNESGPTTGIFRLNILASSAASDASANPPQLQVGANDVITLKYVDASPSQTTSATIKVETTNPVFSNLTPANGTAGQLARPEVEGDVTDADSTVSKKTITVIFAIDDDGDGDIDNTKPAQEVNVDADGEITTVAGGYHAKQRLPSAMAPPTNATIYWWIKATDVAGNVGVSDRQPTISGAADSCTSANFPAVGSLNGVAVGTSASVAGCQPFSIKVDFTKPTLSSAVTGSSWDSTKTTTDKTETSVTKAVNTSIRVDFSEDVDGTTIQSADFKVDGITPLTAEWFSGRKGSVFLGVPALEPNARPKVELAGEVKDVAGNPQTVGSIAAITDGIAPGLTVTITGTSASRPVTTGKITVNIVADEDVGQPTVSISQIGDHSTTTALGTPVAVAPTLKSAKTYEATFTGTTPGLYNVYVTAKDTTQSNQGSKGVNTGPVDIVDSTTKALLFEVDTGVGTAEIGPATTDDVDSFITIDFGAEGTEYASTATAGNDFDSHDTVTITSATLDGTDITPLASTDNKTFLYKATGLTEAEHTVKVKAKDAAGNEKEFTGKVKVTARKPFELKLNPGWNLVSIPGEPADSAINTVVSASHPATTILTYDASVPGGWLTAVRGDDGAFAGTLTDITAGRAYWVLTNSFESIKVTIPRLSSGAAMLPPTVNIVEGWNFVPVLDVTGAKVSGNTITSASYFANLTLSRVYTFNTIGNVWEDKTGASVAVGTGYWVYATKAGTLVP